MTETKLNTEQRAVVLEKILSLRRLTHETTMKTTRSQTTLLNGLSSDDLTAISVELSRHVQQYGW